MEEEEKQEAEMATDGDGDGDGGAMGSEKRVSKGEVLDRARQRIKELEAQNEMLERQRDELLERLRATYAPGLGRMPDPTG